MSIVRRVAWLPVWLFVLTTMFLGCVNIDRVLSDGMDTETESIGNTDGDVDGDADGDSDGDTDGDSDTDNNHGWDIGDCQEDIVPTGGPLHIGDVSPDFTLLNQYWDFTRLYDFCHKTVLVRFVAASQPDCVDEAPLMQEWYETYKNNDFIVLTVMQEGVFDDPESGGSEPNLYDLTQWVELGEATHPVLSDPNATNYLIWETEAESEQPGYSWPRMRLMSPGMVIEAMYPDPDTYFGQMDIEEALAN